MVHSSVVAAAEACYLHLVWAFVMRVLVIGDGSFLVHSSLVDADAQCILVLVNLVWARLVHIFVVAVMKTLCH